ncbi:MAG TPA: hypothetical protein VHT27_01740 [Solirubrobacteraceae bacterium]|nr:hypothetical protein [Solirubrobacteraceae bacterium]
MPDRTAHAPASRPGFPGPPLLAGSGGIPRLAAADALAALARGMQEAGCEQPDVLPVPGAGAGDPVRLRELLAYERFDERMRAARALVICVPRLLPAALARSLAFELATRARQAGVPALAVAGESRIDAFQARILDLQAIELARGREGLRAAGRAVARMLSAGSQDTSR